MEEIPKILPKKITDKYDIIKNTFIGKDKGELHAEREIEIGDIHSDDFQPQFKMMNWENETNMSVRLIDNEPDIPKIETEGNKIKFIKNKLEAHFYDVPKDEDKPFTTIRNIKLGKLNPTEMAATYDLYRKVELEQPTIITYRPNQEMFWLEGRYAKDRDLILEKLDKPIARYDTVPYFKAMSVDENTLISDFVYYSGQVGDVSKILVSAVSEVLANYGIEIEEKTPGRLFIKGTNKKFLSFARHGDNHFVYYVRLKAPSFDYRSYYKEHTQGDYEHIGLQEVNSEITDSIANEINEKLIERLGFQFIQNTLTIDEQTALQELQTVLSKTEWIENGERDDVLNTKQTDDTYEFEVILKEKPATNKVQMSIETKGLRFCYQAKLTQERMNKEYFRPENVIGSYAVYHESKQGDYSKMGLKNYRAGKAFHIYRPKIIDNAGTEVWGKLNIDIEKSILTVEIPQEFLDNAVYPIRHAAGLTFGNTNAGASTAIITNQLRGVIDDPASSGVADSITAYVNIYTADDFKGAIYDFEYTNANKLGETSEVKGAGSAGWQTANFSSGPNLTALTSYWIMIGAEHTSKPSPYLYHDDIWTSDGKGSTNWTYPTLPDPSNFTGENAGYSIYCTYTAGGATQKNVSDVGSGAEALSLLNKASVSEAGSGSEIISILAALAISDSGTASEILSILSKIAITETGAGTEALAILIQLALTDTGAGQEAINALIELAVSDTGIGSETLEILGQITVSDSGLGSEEIEILSQIAVAETGAGIDAITIPSLVDIVDSATGNVIITLIKHKSFGKEPSVLVVASNKTAFGSTDKKAILETKEI